MIGEGATLGVLVEAHIIQEVEAQATAAVILARARGLLTFHANSEYFICLFVCLRIMVNASVH